MASTELVTLVNKKDRSYDGIRKGWTIEVEKSRVSEYVSYGFEVVRNPVVATKTPKAEEKSADKPAPAEDKKQEDKTPKAEEKSAEKK